MFSMDLRYQKRQQTISVERQHRQTPYDQKLHPTHLHLVCESICRWKNYFRANWSDP